MPTNEIELIGSLGSETLRFVVGYVSTLLPDGVLDQAVRSARANEAQLDLIRQARRSNEELDPQPFSSSASALATSVILGPRPTNAMVADMYLRATSYADDLAALTASREMRDALTAERARADAYQARIAELTNTATPEGVSL